MSENRGSKISLPFDLLFKNSNDKVFVTNGNQVLYANEKFINHLELKKEIVFPSDLKSFFGHKDYTGIIKLTNNEYFNSKHDESCQLNIFDKIYDVKYSTIPAKNEQLFLFTIIDKKAKQTTQEISTEIFPFIFFEIDLSGKIKSYNHHFTRQLLYADKDILDGLYLKKILSSGSKPTAESLLKNFDEFKDHEYIELKFKKNNGESFPGYLYYQPITKSQQITGLNCLVLDISANKQIEYKYKRNQQRLRKVLDLVPHMIFLKDENGNILLANKACADFYNTTTKQLVYSNISDFHKSKAECSEIIAEDREVIRTKSEKFVKTVVRTDLGLKKHSYEATKIPFTEPKSKKTHSLGILVDVTEKKHAEQEIEEAKEKYRLLVERGTDGILIVQTQTIVFANNQAASIFGQPIEDIINQPLRRFVKRNHLKKAIEKYTKDAKNKNLDNYYEVKISKPEGDETYAEAKVATVNYEGKKSRLVFIRDITKRKQAEKKSERDKNMLNQAQKIAKLGSWYWDVQKKSFVCSDEIYRILGIEKTQIAEKNPKWFANFIPDFERENVLDCFINSLRKEEPLDIEFPIITSQKERKIIHSQSQVYFDKNGRLERVIGTLLDISERIRIEQALKEAKLKAEEADKLKSAFLANMSHEIRTPMNAILGFASLLKRQELPKDIHQEYIDHIQQSGEGLLKLINDIVDISKIESNQLQIENGPVLINDLLDKLYNRYEELLILKNRQTIRLRVEKALPDPNFTVISDAFRLQQVISNLLNNSLKFTMNGEITFGYKIVNSTLEFFVVDEGVGIADDKKDQIFKRFGKLDDPSRMNKSGTGLGLSISKSLLNLMGGKIWLESGEPGNTRFCFSIPLQFAEKEKSQEKKCAESPCCMNSELVGKTILIAEDELLNYKLLETLLKKTGAKVLWAKNGQEAVEAVSSKKVDLIFMDIKMPKMNGYEATRAIKKIDNSIPIIAQTAFAFANEKKYILQSGCDMYLTKPIDHKEIYDVVNRFLVEK
jgi:PAS domain S-box-containing protein